MADKTVQVALRIRPLIPIESAKGCKKVLETYSDINQVRIKDTDRAFTYNHVFDTNSTQDAIYEDCVKAMIDNLFNGYNLTILAYGQTGSGKTHTMGTTYTGEGDMGVIPRAVTQIFDHIRDNFTQEFNVSVSFMELYQETLYDLLSDKSRDHCVLDIREDPTKGILIPGLTQIPVHSVKEVFAELIRGSSTRATSATNMNAQSSRSHAIFTVNLVIRNKSDGSEKTAKFHFVDLAGSERPKKTGAVGTTFKEGVNINKGLLVLGNVISALGDEKLQHGYIPYRDSNLTRLLKDSLGGNSITLMIACVSPADYNLEETLSTLRYADRARRIQNKPVVNQDPKAAEINFLQKTIQELRLQIISQGGPKVCTDDMLSIKDENLRLQAKIRDLTLQLSTTLNDNTGLLEKLMILQNSSELLHSKIQELKNDYDAIIEKIKSKPELLQEDLEKLLEIQQQFVSIVDEQKKTENEIISHEHSLDLHNSQNRQVTLIEDLSKDQENYTNKQMELNNELQELTKKLALKEHLARQITTNTQHLVDIKAMTENEEKIQNLQKEKEELLQQLRNAQGSSTKISEQRRKRVQELESQIQDLNRKVQEQARLIKLKEKDVTKINRLNHEILQMKQMKVKLIRKMREESERFKTWKIQREREMAKLKQEDRKKQNQIVKMEAIHSKQQNVLKRKVEEAVALNKRLKDALALRKAAQDSKNLGKVDKIGHWIKQEVHVRMHLIEAEVTLAGLLDDRAILQQQLDKLKQDPEAAEDDIKNIEDDIELRSTQIQDLQQKLLDSDEENKKSKFDNIQTMAEAKVAMKIIMEEIAETKKNEILAKNKLLENTSSIADFKEKSENLEKVLKLMEIKHGEDLSYLQKDYEDKIAVLLRELRGIKGQSDCNDEWRKMCAIQSQKLELFEKTNQDLMSELHEVQTESQKLKEKIDTITNLAQTSEVEATKVLQEFKTPVNLRKSIKIKRDHDLTFTIDNQENVDLSFNDDADDIVKDPDWRKTPLGKWILEKKRSGRTKNSDESLASHTLKRTSEGGCLCTKGNCKKCVCNKTNRRCSLNCKCSQNCTNRSEQAESDSFNGDDEKKARKTDSRLRRVSCERALFASIRFKALETLKRN